MENGTEVVLYDGPDVTDYDREYLGHRGWYLNEEGNSLNGWTDFYFTWKDVGIVNDCKVIGGENWYLVEWTNRHGTTRKAWFPPEQIRTKD